VSASEAVFGCSRPAASGPESITTMIAATTRKIATTYVQAVSEFHPPRSAICTDIAERDAGRVKVFEQKARGHLDAARLAARCWSTGRLGVAALARRSVAAYVADISARRKPNWRGRFRRGAPPSAPARRRRPLAARALERRKHETPPA
jgi:general secretion pathway protein L